MAEHFFNIYINFVACQDDHISIVLFAVILQENIKNIFFILLPEQICICNAFLVQLFKLFKLTRVPLKLLSGQLLIIILWDLS